MVAVQRGGGGGPGGGPGGPGGFGGPGGNLSWLADNEVVAKELKLTDRQKPKVKESPSAKQQAGRGYQQTAPADRNATNRRPSKRRPGHARRRQIDPPLTLAAREPARRSAGALKASGYQSGPDVMGASRGQARWDPGAVAAGRTVPGPTGGQRRAGPGPQDDVRSDAAASEINLKVNSPKPWIRPRSSGSRRFSSRSRAHPRCCGCGCRRKARNYRGAGRRDPGKS